MSKETHKKIVVDIGNTHCKWGRVVGEVVVEKAILPLHDWNDACNKQLAKWEICNSARFVLAGVNPAIVKEQESWLKARHYSPFIIDRYQSIPIRVDVEFPERVGLDRLFNAVAAERKPAVIVDAGSAVTVDAVNQKGDFLGGAIFPGLRLMAEALHMNTAQLPKIEITFPAPKLPGKNTVNAIHAGIVQAVAGGIVNCVNELTAVLGTHVTIYLTGGNGEGLRSCLPFSVIQVPLLTLQGIYLAARSHGYV